MSTKNVIIVGSAIGGIISLFVLGLLWFGESGALTWRHTDWTYVLWPSSILLVVGWRSTVPGIVITVASIALNCSMYIAVVFLLRTLLRWIARHKTQFGNPS